MTEGCTSKAVVTALLAAVQYPVLNRDKEHNRRANRFPEKR